MGILDGLMGNATNLSKEDAEKEIAEIMIDGEEVDLGFKVIRDMFIFTSKRLIMIDVQGVTGKKVDYHSFPYGSIEHFAIETSGHFGDDSELKMWVRGGYQVVKEFKKGSDIKGLGKALAAYILK